VEVIPDLSPGLVIGISYGKEDVDIMRPLGWASLLCISRVEVKPFCTTLKKALKENVETGIFV
jgi:hypothetical protein